MTPNQAGTRTLISIIGGSGEDFLIGATKKTLHPSSSTSITVINEDAIDDENATSDIVETIPQSAI